MTIAITPLTPADLDTAARDLARVLHGCVQDGASVGFVLPFPVETAEDYWQTRVFPAVRRSEILLLAAWRADRIVGTVQLVPATMPNQPHRADIAKLLVSPAHRRQGIARHLMTRLETEALDRGRHLLVLDTRSGDPSQRLYESMGFQTAGQIPGYCLDPFGAGFDPTTYLYKTLT